MSVHCIRHFKFTVYLKNVIVKCWEKRVIVEKERPFSTPPLPPPTKDLFHQLQVKRNSNKLSSESMTGD